MSFQEYMSLVYLGGLSRGSSTFSASILLSYLKLSWQELGGRNTQQETLRTWWFKGKQSPAVYLQFLESLIYLPVPSSLHTLSACGPWSPPSHSSPSHQSELSSASPPPASHHLLKRPRLPSNLLCIFEANFISWDYAMSFGRKAPMYLAKTSFSPTWQLFFVSCEHQRAACTSFCLLITPTLPPTAQSKSKLPGSMWGTELATEASLKRS